MGFPRVHPLADFPAALRDYNWPNPDDERICGPIYEKAKEWDSDNVFLAGSHRETLWEKSYMLVGMEKLMCSFYEEPQAAGDLLHRVMDFQLAIARHYLEVGIEIASLGDDLGTQRGLLLPPEILHDLFVPEYRRLFGLYRRHGVVITFHSCGHVTSILDVFMDLGVDVLNPVQATANDLDEVRRITQGRMALQGAVSSATVVSGPVSAIRREVAQRLWQLGREGGYFCGPDQGMPWPKEHIDALHEAVDEMGRYPLKPPA
jgi:uroporphyrinogen decarboxylase